MRSGSKAKPNGRVVTWMAAIIPPFLQVDTAPPNKIWPFVRWCLQGAGPAIIFGCVVATLAGIVEILSAILLGNVIDAALSAGPDNVFRQHIWLLLFVSLFQNCPGGMANRSAP